MLYLVVLWSIGEKEGLLAITSVFRSPYPTEHSFVILRNRMAEFNKL